jgi:hypothetical protein
MSEVTHWLAAVDYVRMSWRAGSMDEEGYSLLWPKLRGCAQEAAGAGIEVETVKMLGYIGLKAGPLFLGLSYQGAMLQASGLTAQLVCELGLVPDNVSRMDLQATVWLREDDEGLARRVADDVEEAYKGRRGRRPAVRYIDGYGRGNTAYVGSRGKRAVFIRVYDKARESGESVYSGAWRYEAELTDDYARDAYYTAMESRFGEPMIARLLIGYLDLRGVSLSLPNESRGFDRASLPRGATTRERRLAWLQKQVRPTVERLMLDGVSREELVSLLGLSG